MARLIDADPVDVAVAEVVATLQSGGTVVLPTDTVYGLAALPSRGDAVARVFELKQRPAGMHLAVLLADADQIPLVSTDARSGVAVIAEAFWPGALTLVLPDATDLVAGLGNGDGTVGVRCPDHDLVRAIARRVGPIAVTSANGHGKPTPPTAPEVAAELPGTDLVIDGGPCRGGVASTVADCTGDVPVVVREGPVSDTSIARAWASG